MAADIWPTVRAERTALADDVGSLTDEQWNTPSLCTDWTVRDVLAHMTATAKVNGLAFFGKLVTNGFSLTKMQTRDITAERGATPADTLAGFRSVIESEQHPPGPLDTWLGEVIVHAEDIRRPLDITHAYDTAAAVRVADFYKGSNLIIGAKKRIAGLRLRATDAEWTTGDGPEVAGPIVALVLAMTGRKPAHADLTGDGVATLSARD
jgi:uncharacterized protein (TIGR03083 family)